MFTAKYLDFLYCSEIKWLQFGCWILWQEDTFDVGEAISKILDDLEYYEWKVIFSSRRQDQPYYTQSLQKINPGAGLGLIKRRDMKRLSSDWKRLPKRYFCKMMISLVNLKDKIFFKNIHFLNKKTNFFYFNIHLFAKGWLIDR